MFFQRFLQHKHNSTSCQSEKDRARPLGDEEGVLTQKWGKCLQFNGLSTFSTHQPNSLTNADVRHIYQNLPRNSFRAADIQQFFRYVLDRVRDPAEFICFLLHICYDECTITWHVSPKQNPMQMLEEFNNVAALITQMVTGCVFYRQAIEFL